MDMLANLFRDHLFRTASFEKPKALYVSLHTENGREVTGPGYARARLDPGDENWTTAERDGFATNAKDLVFAEPAGDWGRVAQYALWDDATAGRCFSGLCELARKKNINDGDEAPRFKAGSLTFQFKLHE